MTLQEMMKRRAELGMTYEELSRRSGVPLPTVQKIFSGKTQSPRLTTLAALEKALREENGQSYSISFGERDKRFSGSQSKFVYPDALGTSSGKNASLVRESSAAYAKKKPGEYTVDDWFNLPEDAHKELIDGVLYDLAEPTTIHQLIAGQLYAMFLACITNHHMDCIPFIAPCGVQLDNDDKTMVEPDVFIICDKDRILRSHVPGAPDLAVEVLSPGTRKKDMTLKYMKYWNGGVREYWIIDPDKKKIIVYTFAPDQKDGKSDPDINLYGFDDVIPVGISGGMCSIDFHQIHNYVQFLYDKPEGV